MPLASIARFFNSFRRNRREQHDNRRLRRHRSSRRVQTVPSTNGVVHVPTMESVEFEIRSNRSMSSSFYFTYSGARTDRLGRGNADVSMSSIRSFRAMDPVEVAKVEQKKLRKALEHAVRQERKEARKIKKLIDKKDKTATNHSASSSRITLLSVDTVSDCSATSDEDILAEIWAMRSPSLDGASDDDLHAFDDERSETAPIEFLFFTGCPDDKNLRELDVGYRRLRSNPRATRYPVTPSYATSVHIKPTLVSNMPPLFAPHFDIVLG